MTTLVLDTLGVLAIAAAVLVITAHSPVASVMWLIAVFMLAACYLVCLGVTFVGLSYLVVYVGAVAVLFLFVVMMLNVRLSEVVAARSEYTKSLGFAVSLVFLYEVLAVIGAPGTYADGSVSSGAGTRSGEFALGLLSTANSYLLGTPSGGGTVHMAFSSSAADAAFSGVSQVQALGLSLYTYHAFTLMLVSVVLLMSMMGPISLCRPAST